MKLWVHASLRRPSRAFALLGCALAAGLVACGSDGGSSTPSTTPAATSPSTSSTPASTSAPSGDFGTGLKVTDQVVSEAEIFKTVEPWLRWNKKSCAYEETTDHPAEYKAQIRKIDGSSTIGYMHYGDSDPFGIANSTSVKESAKAAGFTLNVYNLQYPSTTVPLDVAKTAVLRHDQGALQGNLDPTVLPQFFKEIEGKGCMPSIALYGGVGDKRPSIGAIYEDAGTLQGEYLAKEAQARNFAPDETAFVQCTDPSLAPFIAAMFPASAKALTAKGFALPDANLFKLDCSGQSSTKAVAAVKAWITGHPKFKHLLFNAPDDLRVTGIIAALKAAKRLTDDTISIGAGLDQLGQQQVRSGGETASIAFFPERAGQYLVPMLEDVMAGNAVPQFVEQAIFVVTKDDLDKYYPA